MRNDGGTMHGYAEMTRPGSGWEDLSEELALAMKRRHQVAPSGQQQHLSAEETSRALAQ